MAERRIDFLVSIDLAKGSKEAHAVTIDKIAEQVGKFATERMETYGYGVRRATSTTTLHYVRHTLTHIIKSPRTLRVVRKASGQ